MLQNIKSVRPFLGAKDFAISRSFYREVGFAEKELGDDMSVFKSGNFAFYLQKAYVKDWIDNTMVFLEVENANAFFAYLHSLDLPGKYPGVRLTPVKTFDWGAEGYLHDPSGILWHFGEFRQ